MDQKLQSGQLVTHKLTNKILVVLGEAQPQYTDEDYLCRNEKGNVEVYARGELMTEEEVKKAKK